MNTANLQLTGLYAALTALVGALRAKGALTEGEIDRAFDAAEHQAVADAGRAPELSSANIDAICFPIRYLRAANRLLKDGIQPSFTEVTGVVARSKSDPEHD